MNANSEDVFGASAVYCINLDRRPQRWEQARRAIVSAGFPSVQRFSAVDGTSIEFDDPRLSVRLAAIVKKTHMAPLGVKRGVIGCYLSHFALWQEVVAKNIACCIVFEDDVRFVRNFRDKLLRSIGSSNLIGLDMFFFGYLKRGALDEDGRLKGRIWGTQSYFLTASGARRLLERAIPVCEAVDEYIEHLTELESDFKIYCVDKPLVRQRSIMSDVQPISYSFGNKLSRLTMAFLFFCFLFFIFSLLGKH